MIAWATAVLLAAPIAAGIGAGIAVDAYLVLRDLRRRGEHRIPAATPGAAGE